jgi:hypothetical protein
MAGVPFKKTRNKRDSELSLGFTRTVPGPIFGLLDCRERSGTDKVRQKQTKGFKADRIDR